MTILPELKSGNVLVTKHGNRIVVRRIARPKRDTGLDEPIYRLIFSLASGTQYVGNGEWTREEIQTAGCKMA